MILMIVRQAYRQKWFVYEFDPPPHTHLLVMFPCAKTEAAQHAALTVSGLSICVDRMSAR